MKLHIHGQTLRWRIDEAELARLLAGETILNATALGQAGVFSQALCLHAQAPPALEISPDRWVLRLPQDVVRDYVSRLPCRDALGFELALGEGAMLLLRLEVDVRDSLQVRGARRREIG